MESRRALAGIRVLDLSRVLAGPSSTQILGDLGADIIKVERPGAGDETRTWGPPYLRDEDGNETSESAYYLSCNRNKRSVTINLASSEGVELLKALLRKSDVVIENFKPGNLSKYKLTYDDLKDEFPSLIYCSITGYGQTGPYAERPGYDLIAQGLGGLISMTGEPGQPPVKVPIAVNDVMTGMYACVAILAALRHRDLTGEGQYIDLGLLDVQVAWLYNQGLNYLVSGDVPARLGSAHPNVVPYQVFEAKDGYVIVGLNNDEQFKRFCHHVERADLLEDPRFATNADRVRNRDVVVSMMAEIFKSERREYWLTELSSIKVTCSAVNTLDQVFVDPHVLARGMKVCSPHPLSGTGSVELIGNPIKMSRTPVSYERPPPILGEHTDEVLSELLDMSADDRLRLRRQGAI